MKDRSGKNSKEENRVWLLTRTPAKDILARALKKACLDKRDRATGRRLLHQHSCHKFFRSDIRLDEPLTKALMEHVKGLDRSYLRIGVERTAEQYKENMGNVAIFSRGGAEMKETIGVARNTALAGIEASARQLGLSVKEIEVAKRVAPLFVKE